MPIFLISARVNSNNTVNLMLMQNHRKKVLYVNYHFKRKTKLTRVIKWALINIFKLHISTRSHLVVYSHFLLPQYMIGQTIICLKTKIISPNL